VTSLQLGDNHPVGNDETSIDFAANGRATAPAREGVLEIAPRIYREYASEFRKSAREAMSDSQREIYLKAAQMWHEAAQLFELETGQLKSGRRKQHKPAA
jgi:hypothetical protein